MGALRSRVLESRFHSQVVQEGGWWVSCQTIAIQSADFIPKVMPAGCDHACFHYLHITTAGSIYWGLTLGKWALSARMHARTHTHARALEKGPRCEKFVLACGHLQVFWGGKMFVHTNLSARHTIYTGCQESRVIHAKGVQMNWRVQGRGCTWAGVCLDREVGLGHPRQRNRQYGRNSHSGVQRLRRAGGHLMKDISFYRLWAVFKVSK